MISSLSLKNFRGFDSFELSELAQINLIAGKNNVGKTALLEAAHLLFSTGNPFSVNEIEMSRGVSRLRSERQNYFQWLFHNNLPLSIEISARDSLNVVHYLEVSQNKFEATAQLPFEDEVNRETETQENETDFWKEKNIQLYFRYWNSTNSNDIFQYVYEDRGILRRSSRLIVFPESLYLDTSRRRIPIADIYSAAFEKGHESDVSRVLSIIEPNLKRIVVASRKGEAVINVDLLKEGLMPIHIAGDGLRSALAMVSAIYAFSNGYVLIDEFDNGLHYSVLEDVWRSVDEAVRDANVQVLATTHSYECIAAASNIFANRSVNEFAMFRLERTPSGCNYVRYDATELQSAIELGLEAR